MCKYMWLSVRRVSVEIVWQDAFFSAWTEQSLHHKYLIIEADFTILVKYEWVGYVSLSIVNIQKTVSRVT